MADTSLSLLDRARLRQDRSSWEELVSLYQPVLRAWLRPYHLQPSDEDDLVQEILAALSRELPQFEHNGRRGAFRRWLRTIAIHRLQAFWRSRRHRPAAGGGTDFLAQLQQIEDPHSEASRRWDREHDAHLLRQLLAMIEPRFNETTRQAFRRTALDGAPAAEVAQELGMTVNAVLIARCRVLKELKREGRGLLGE